MPILHTVCPDCGSEMSNKFENYEFDRYFTGVSCEDCGREITKDDFLSKATDPVKNKLDDMLRNSLKGIDWKF